MEVKITRDTPIDRLEISVRLAHCLYNLKPLVRNELLTVGDFIDIPDHELLRTNNFGRKTLQEWKNIVRRVENPDDPTIEEDIAEERALRDMRTILNKIAGVHTVLARHYRDLAAILKPEW